MKDYYDAAKKAVIILWQENNNQSIAHQASHIDDVYEYAMLLVKLAKANDKKIDADILKMSILGHDLIQPVKGDKACHVADSARGYETILKEIEYPENDIRRVLQIIFEHSSEIINRPTSDEAKILYIADKWTGVGPKGVERVREYCHERGIYGKEALKWYKKKMEKAMPLFYEFLKEIPGSDIALDDVNYTLSFLADAEKTQIF